MPDFQNMAYLKSRKSEEFRIPSVKKYSLDMTVLKELSYLVNTEEVKKAGPVRLKV